MKAILVVDIPEDYTGSVISVNLYGRNNKVIHEIHTNKLRPMPLKGTMENVVECEYNRGFVDGRNHCIDLIMGETE